MAKLTIDDVNALPLDDFERSIGPVYEHSPWVARAGWSARPFADLRALGQALRAVVDGASTEEREAILRAHPDLAGRELADGSLTTSSSGEQRSVGLDALDPAQRRHLHALARTYRERFGFPCVICVREAGSVEAILAETARRTGSTLDEERERAIGEVHKIAWLRLLDLVGKRAA